MDQPTDRDLLVGISYKVTDLHEIVKGTPGKKGLADRVDDLESSRDKLEGMVVIAKAGGVSGFLGGLAGIWHVITHYLQGK